MIYSNINTNSNTNKNSNTNSNSNININTNVNRKDSDNYSIINKNYLKKKIYVSVPQNISNYINIGKKYKIRGINSYSDYNTSPRKDLQNSSPNSNSNSNDFNINYINEEVNEISDYIDIDIENNKQINKKNYKLKNKRNNINNLDMSNNNDIVLPSTSEMLIIPRNESSKILNNQGENYRKIKNNQIYNNSNNYNNDSSKNNFNSNNNKNLYINRSPKKSKISQDDIFKDKSIKNYDRNINEVNNSIKLIRNQKNSNYSITNNNNNNNNILMGIYLY